MSGLIRDSSLRGWKAIGSGGFGQIFKARHCAWGCDVAVKLLRFDDGTTSASLLREIDMMRLGSSPHVILVRGLFEGRVPPSSYTQLGLVMEFMERGSLATLQDRLHEAPPWPLVFRLAHQVALGINFLHSLTPALLHLDLKPGNVLLDNDLNAKITDFGLSRFYHSATRGSQKDGDEEGGGTISYMPPEAFDLSYKPGREFDVYSYGILLWSIVSGTKPYAHAKSSLVRFRIPEGDRPPLDGIRLQAAELAELTRLTELMERCWHTEPQRRPSTLACTTEAEELYNMHKLNISDAVHRVLKKLDQKEEEIMREQMERVHVSPVSVSESEEAKIRDTVPTGRPPIQEMDDSGNANRRDVATANGLPTSRPASGCYDDVSRQSTDDGVKRSSVCPIQPAPASTGTSHRDRTAKPSPKGFPPQYHRQLSSPGTFTCQPAAAARVQMNFSNVTGFQYGNNNTMNLEVREHSARKRHTTAPPRVNLQGSCKDKTGGGR
ncbi:receptor-interacting serine/threonine-protein kinase 3 isoform X2 [Cyclopterus lumpus]|uniref:Receptor-interacting serine-threonine kinase 3 n=1 Tax=Cyclopterus lumpus TaxID=8103 RepID=A0A8C3ABQ0_CYCLU|nr:receptor-interacting serine/threonine-protein kinase 3 isoform X2 [Cyclopterus lumpus]